MRNRSVRLLLSPEQAQALVNQMATPRPSPPPIGEMNQIGATLTQIGQGSGKGDKEISQHWHSTFTARHFG